MPTSEPVKIFVVEDDEVLRCEVLRCIVCKELSNFGFGYRVDQANDGEEPIATLQVNRVGLITLDIILPKVDGWGVPKFVKEYHPATRVVVLTMYGSVENATRARKKGVDAFLKKTVSGERTHFHH